MEMVNRKRQRHDSREREIESVLWYDLPIEILNMIVERLSFIDQIHFRAVCKNWQLIHVVRPVNKLPWLMAHDWSFTDDGNILSTSRYYFPSLNQHYTREIKVMWETWGVSFGAHVCASKYGWLLLQKYENPPFLYNPLTKAIIKLPDLDISFNRATFSSCPTSTKCVFFAIQSSKDSDKIIVRMCRHGDVEWSTHIFDGFFKVIEDVVYSKGVFYCVFKGGVLGAFYVAHGDWSMLTGMEPFLGIRYRYRAQMVAVNGQLLLVCSSNVFHLFWFNWSRMDWVRNNNLGNRAIFLGCTSFAISAVGEATNLADKVYYHGDTHTCFYSFTTRKHLRCSEFYPWAIQRSLERVWIQPPPRSGTPRQ